MTIYYTDGFKGGRDESHRLLAEAIAADTGDAGLAGRLVKELKTGEMGKPYIEGFRHFSISHTGSIWAVIMADFECGLDIQQGRACDIIAIARRLYDPADAASIESTGSAEEFFRIWARREALVKAVGGSVYETDLPSVAGDKVCIGGSVYLIRDIEIPEMTRLYSAVALPCSQCREDTLRIRFRQL